MVGVGTVGVSGVVGVVPLSIAVLYCPTLGAYTPVTEEGITGVYGRSRGLVVFKALTFPVIPNAEGA